MTRQRSIGAAIAGFCAIVALVVGFWALGTWIAMLLWNAICHNVFGWPALSFWLMAGLILLIGLVCGGIRSSCSSK